MKISAKEMHLSPAKAYRSADLGEKVVINHDRYPDKIFELVARDRKPLPEQIQATASEELNQAV